MSTIIAVISILMLAFSIFWITVQIRNYFLKRKIQEAYQTMAEMPAKKRLSIVKK